MGGRELVCCKKKAEQTGGRGISNFVDNQKRLGGKFACPQVSSTPATYSVLKTYGNHLESLSHWIHTWRKTLTSFFSKCLLEQQFTDATEEWCQSSFVRPIRLTPHHHHLSSSELFCLKYIWIKRIKRESAIFNGILGRKQYDVIWYLDVTWHTNVTIKQTSSYKIHLYSCKHSCDT